VFYTLTPRVRYYYRGRGMYKTYIKHTRGVIRVEYRYRVRNVLAKWCARLLSFFFLTRNAFSTRSFISRHIESVVRQKKKNRKGTETKKPHEINGDYHARVSLHTVATNTYLYRCITHILYHPHSALVFLFFPRRFPWK